MDCARCRRLIQEELDGEIALRDLESLEAHATECPSCRAERTVLSAIDAVLDEGIPARSPAWMADAVLEGISHQRRTRRIVETVVIGAASAVATAAAVAGVARVVDPDSIESSGQSLIGSLVGGLRAATDAAAAYVMKVPGADSISIDQPIVIGIAWALAAAALAFLAIGTLRASRQLADEWH